jgi:hypothetical protein
MENKIKGIKQQRISHGEASQALETLLKYADQEPDMGVTTQVLLFGQAKEDH